MDLASPNLKKEKTRASQTWQEKDLEGGSACNSDKNKKCKSNINKFPKSNKRELNG